MARKQSDWLSAEQASARLGVKLATLYAYTSRGLITSMPSESARGHRYAREDVERLRTRHDARAGHGPVAASALRFGEPVLETRISHVSREGLFYRGHSAVELCRTGVGFERVAELLWTGSLPDTAPVVGQSSASLSKRVWPLLLGSRRERGGMLAKMALILAALALGDEDRHTQADAAEQARARVVTRWLACTPASTPPKAVPGSDVASVLLRALGVTPTESLREHVDRALVLSAEHELNASTFAARVAASAGADLYACLGAAVGTLSGSAHGGMCDRVEALLETIGSRGRATRTVRDWLARGEHVPGFGHPLYPDGDPRGTLLLELARAHGAKTEAADTALALIDAMAAGGHPLPTLDAGLVTLCQCLELPRGTAAIIFAVGRTAGWVAHILEQRAAGFLLRPRARYVGEQTRA